MQPTVLVAGRPVTDPAEVFPADLAAQRVLRDMAATQSPWSFVDVDHLRADVAMRQTAFALLRQTGRVDVRGRYSHGGFDFWYTDRWNGRPEFCRGWTSVFTEPHREDRTWVYHRMRRRDDPPWNDPTRVPTLAALPSQLLRNLREGRTRADCLTATLACQLLAMASVRSPQWQDRHFAPPNDPYVGYRFIHDWCDELAVDAAWLPGDGFCFMNRDDYWPRCQARLDQLTRRQRRRLPWDFGLWTALNGLQGTGPGEQFAGLGMLGGLTANQLREELRHAYERDTGQRLSRMQAEHDVRITRRWRLRVLVAEGEGGG
jgi:hypothetical protein